MRKISLLFGALLLACLLVLPCGAQAQGGPNPVVIFETTLGRFIVMLYPGEAPATVENFMRYVDEGFYDGTLFHRVVTDKDFRQKSLAGGNPIPYNIIQGGGFEMGMRLKQTHPPIPNESSRAMSNKQGTIAMARGTAPDSATAQFFINVKDNPAFDYRDQKDPRDETKIISHPGYTAFGKVIRGWDVVEAISRVETSRMGQHENVPVKPVFIIKAYRPQ
ncbi:peptidylprolyl isomerase [Pseudodesulfovibrio sp. F-1]|uniref:Peptidyl-prolyl cis-trans isomerase n=1 Tax=Pseudodesulfovibrio alkaliphilus TaxID=2661613 RepID=A0A7K1KN54_9BACT|nr:peptidylprolyl isomerase [Pseudodesulfovibrio alkaliphilus]MUM77514.1 peptidylprolyl isomerase [Pseudodesulfovibrio alkaliphilus]